MFDVHVQSDSPEHDPVKIIKNGAWPRLCDRYIFFGVRWQLLQNGQSYGLYEFGTQRYIFLVISYIN